MTPGIYSVVSALDARWAQQTANAQNISGANTLGHKRSVVAFGSFNKVINSVSSGVQQSIAEPIVYSKPISYDWSSGPMVSTGQALDAGIVGDGFFQVQTPAGPRLTRAGHFSVNSDKLLVNDAGFPVLSSGGGTITAESGATLGPDGTVSVNGRSVNKVAVYSVDHLDLLKSEGGGMFVPGYAKVTEVSTPKLAPGHLEQSNLDAPTEMATMIQNQRMYDMLTRAFQAQDEGVSKAIQDLSGA